MAELAIVLPVLLVLLLGIVQFGVAFNNYISLTDAVRAGARKAAVSRNSPDPAGACRARVPRVGRKPRYDGARQKSLVHVELPTRVGRHGARRLPL